MGALAPGSCLTLSHGTGGITIQLRPKASMRSIHQRVPGGPAENTAPALRVSRGEQRGPQRVLHAGGPGPCIKFPQVKTILP